MADYPPIRYSDDDLCVIVQDWSEKNPDQLVAINLARELLQRRAANPTPRLVPDRPSDRAISALREVIAHYADHGPVGHVAGKFIRQHGHALLAAIDAAAPPAEAPAERGDVELIAARYGDESVDLRGRSSWEFDSHGLRKFAAALAAAPAAPAEVPADVMAALDRMCTALDELRDDVRYGRQTNGRENIDKLEAHIAALTARVAELMEIESTLENAADAMSALRQRAEQAEAKAEAHARDAGRYRLVREHAFLIGLKSEHVRAEYAISDPGFLDATVDAMKEPQP